MDQKDYIFEQAKETLDFITKFWRDEHEARLKLEKQLAHLTTGESVPLNDQVQPSIEHGTPSKKRKFTEELSNQELGLLQNDTEMMQLKSEFQSKIDQLTEDLEGEKKAHADELDLLNAQLEDEKNKSAEIQKKFTQWNIRLVKQFRELLDKGKKAVVEKKFDDALEFFNEAIGVEKVSRNEKENITMVVQQKANCYFRLKIYHKAIECRNEVIEFDPSNASNYYNRAVIFYEVKDYEKARANVQKALELDEKYEKAKQLLTKIDSSMK